MSLTSILGMCIKQGKLWQDCVDEHACLLSISKCSDDRSVSILNDGAAPTLRLIVLRLARISV